MARALTLHSPVSDAALRSAKRRFREIFPRGFSDPTYLHWATCSEEYETWPWA